MESTAKPWLEFATSAVLLRMCATTAGSDWFIASLRRPNWDSSSLTLNTAPDK
jgi:hypothetical protein